MSLKKQTKPRCLNIQNIYLYCGLTSHVPFYDIILPVYRWKQRKLLVYFVSQSKLPPFYEYVSGKKCVLNALCPFGLRGSFANVYRIHECDRQFLIQRLPLTPNVHIYLKTEVLDSSVAINLTVWQSHCCSNWIAQAGWKREPGSSVGTDWHVGSSYFAGVGMRTIKDAYFFSTACISVYGYFRTFDRTGQLELNITGIKGFPHLIFVFSRFK
jgi:hypothetical protein